MKEESDTIISFRNVLTRDCERQKLWTIAA